MSKDTSEIEISEVTSGLAELSRSELAVSMDELMSRRRPTQDRRKYLIACWRADRIAWKNKRDEIADKKEGIEEPPE